jgi:ankyrin repeat protein/ketosteroid isomerase-like protein/L-ascorbate metabolism protein UlaG (beta-lactamase superfamily)
VIKIRIYFYVITALFIFYAVLCNAEDSDNIFKLIEEGKTKDVINILDSDQLSLQLKNSNGASLLHAAARAGDISLIEYLLNGGVDINIKDNNGNTPLFEAVDSGKIDVVSLLIDKSADIYAANKYQRTPIFHAARKKGNIALIKILTENGAKLDFVSDMGMTLLHYAVQANDAESVRYFLSKGLDSNAVDYRGRTPLMIAAALESTDLVKVLVENGADIHARHFNGNTPLMIAIDQGSLESVRYLLSKGARVDIFNDQGSFPLHIAARRGEADFVLQLINKSADINVRNIFTGSTPLHIAASRGYGDIVLLVLSLKADPAIKDKNGNTPIDLAVRYGNITSMKTLSDFGAKLYSYNTDSLKALVENLDRGQARIWYLLHCGWAVKTKNAFLIFDYYPGPPNSREPDEPSIANGRINPRMLIGLDVYVFVSHIHEDHFTEKIFEWRKTIPNIKYILGFHYEKDSDYIYAAPNKSYKIGNVAVTTVHESPGDVGFAVKIDGLTILHAGDLSGWIQEMLDNLKVQTDFLANEGIRPDMVFILGAGWTMPYFNKACEGLNYLFDKLKPAIFFPMHNRRVELNNLMSGAQAILDGKVGYTGVGLIPGDMFKYGNSRLSPSPTLEDAKNFAEKFKKEFGEMKEEQEKQDDKSKIEELRRKDIEASLIGDTETLLSLMTDDIILIYPDQPPARGIKVIRDKMQSYKKELENITITQYSYTMDELVIEGGLAYEWGSFYNKYYLKNEGKELEEKGRMMRILRKQPDGSWKVARSIWNTNPD